MDLEEDNEVLGIPSVPGCLLAILMLFLWLYWCRSSSNNLPTGPRGFPLVGYLLHLGKLPHLTLTSLSREYGDVFSIMLGSRDVVVLNGSDVIHEALVKRGDIFAGRPRFEAFEHYAGGTSISFGRYNSLLKAHRRMASTTIRHLVSGKLMPTENILHREITNLLDIWQHQRGPFDPAKSTGIMVASVLYSFCFGEQTTLTDNMEYLDLLTSENPTTELFSAANHVDIAPWLRYFTKRHLVADALTRMKKFVELNTRQVASHYEHGGDAACVLYSMLGSWKRHTSEKLDSQDALPRVHIENTPIEFLSAGTETSTATLLWLFLYMGRNLGVQQRIQAEIDDVIGTRHIKSHDQVLLPYTQACITEVMRLSTIVPFGLPHSTMEATTFGGYTIPRDTLVLVNLWSASYDERIWDSPGEFRPERFLIHSPDGGVTLNEKMARRLYPFGAGRRRCVGESLGKTQVFVMFTSILQRFSVTLTNSDNDGTNCIFGDVMKPQPFRIRVLSRHR